MRLSTVDVRCWLGIMGVEMVGWLPVDVVLSEKIEVCATQVGKATTLNYNPFSED